MKKRFGILLAFVLIFALAACGQTEQTKPADASAAAPQANHAQGASETLTQHAPGNTEAAAVPRITPPSEISDAEGKTLIVYFSWSPSGNTGKMATCIQEQTGGDLLKLEPLNPYPTDYNECGEVAKVERDENARPEIANLPASIAEYDAILVGYPIWRHTAPMIIGTFLESYDLTDVEVYPFAQSASMDAEQFDNSMAFIRENAVGANVHDGLFAAAEDTAGIHEYLKANGFAE